MMKNSALVVVDMLYDFIDGSMACKNSENAVNEAVKAIDRLRTLSPFSLSATITLPTTVHSRNSEASGPPTAYRALTGVTSMRA